MRTLGVNTGTSVDAVDLCLVEWDLANLKDFKILKEKSYPFSKELKQEIEKLIKAQRASFEEVSNSNYLYSYFVAGLIKEFRKEFLDECSRDKSSKTNLNEQNAIELIGLHGQTIFHGHESTWQIGDGSIIANQLGVTTVSDFRPADMALGGQGAPIISYMDHTLVRSETESVGTLNIGGIANLTIMEQGKNTIAYDTGPGNTLIDSLMNRLFSENFDNDGARARQGRVDDHFIDIVIKQNDYFHEEPPKSTGREYFSEKFADKFLDLGNKNNIIATVSYFTVKTITRELEKYNVSKIYISGGGSNNKFIMDKLKEANPGIQFLSHQELGIDDQYKEAILFSLLAFTSLNKVSNSIPSSTGANTATILGKISYVPTN